mmetsp:Transcript_10466/g.20763  ORF Transcript_10466/g.20763 Transcript_10466/m.20763 type:complete len:82 (+) Transcript_10466:49-294(+)
MNSNSVSTALMMTDLPSQEEVSHKDSLQTNQEKLNYYEGQQSRERFLLSHYYLLCPINNQIQPPHNSNNAGDAVPITLVEF